MLTEIEMNTKVCGKCREVKLLSEFNKKKASKDGHRSQCKVCVKEYQAKYYAANPEKEKERKAEYRAANPEKVKEGKAKYYAANSEKLKEVNAKHYAANSEKIKEYCAANSEKKKDYDAEYRAANSEKRKEYQVEYRAANPEKERDRVAEYRAANPEKNRAWCSNRRAAKLEAIPSWLTEEDWQSMEAIGKEADRLTKETGIKHEVDHIIPLQPPKVVMFEGKMIPLICAFHCPSNLQILTKSENCAKSNKFTPYVESELLIK